MIDLNKIDIDAIPYEENIIDILVRDKEIAILSKRISKEKVEYFLFNKILVWRGKNRG